MCSFWASTRSGEWSNGSLMTLRRDFGGDPARIPHDSGKFPQLSAAEDHGAATSPATRHTLGGKSRMSWHTCEPHRHGGGESASANAMSALTGVRKSAMVDAEELGETGAPPQR